jgi:hypothetical protein
LCSQPEAKVEVTFVDGRNTAGPWDGLTWATAFRTIQDGLHRAAGAKIRTNGEVPARAEVWVVAGTYRPTETNDRGASICLRPGVALYTRPS